MTAGCFYQNYREVRLLIIHCSATRYDRDFPVEALRASHKARGFADIGYHFYITRDGYLHDAQIPEHIRHIAARPAPPAPAGLSGGEDSGTLPTESLHPQGLPLLRCQGGVCGIGRGSVKKIDSGV